MTIEPPLYRKAIIQNSIGASAIVLTADVPGRKAIADNIESMVDLAHANGINVVLASVMPVSDHNRNAQGNPIIQTVRRPPDQIEAFNKMLKEIAGERGLVYLDYFSAMVDEKGYLKADIANDGLHPNAKGYELIKPVAANAINAALKMKKPK